MTKDEALRLALEALEQIKRYGNNFLYKQTEKNPYEQLCEAITAIKAALETKDEIDWKDMYEKEKRHSEMWTAKYERDIGPLEKAVPQQEAKDEPVGFKIYKPTPPRGAIPNVRDAELPWVYDQDPSSGNVASMWVTPVQTLRSKS
jgi:hypothetical protein